MNRKYASWILGLAIISLLLVLPVQGNTPDTLAMQAERAGGVLMLGLSYPPDCRGRSQRTAVRGDVHFIYSPAKL